MQMSDMFKFVLSGKPAQLYVCRNNGACWGRVVLQDGTNLDTLTSRDYYDQEDLVAAEAFERAAKRGKTEKTESWPIVWDAGIGPRSTTVEADLLAALEGLVKQIPLKGLNVKKDFSLMVAHAAAVKAIARAKGEV